MARYIDADSLYRRVKTHTNPYGKPTLDYKSGVKVIEMINQEPTADVVPKSEADEIAEELSDTIVMKDELFDEVIKLRGELANAKAEVAHEIFEEIEKITMHNVTSSYGIWLMSMGEDAFAELKKKYIGESDVKRDTV